MRRSLLLFLVALVAIGGIGCGAKSEGSTSVDGGDALARAAERTIRSPQVSAMSSGVLVNSAVGESRVLTSTQVDPASGRTRVWASILPPSPSGADRDHEIIVERASDTRSAFVHIPGLTDRLAAGKSWVRLGAKDPVLTPGMEIPRLMQGSGGDPYTMLQWLNVVSGVRDLGDESFRGRKTTHYRATVRLGRLITTLPADRRDDLEHDLGQRRKIGMPDQFPIDVWISSAGLVRKISYSWTQQSASDGATRARFEASFFANSGKTPIDIPLGSEAIDVESVPREIAARLTS